MTMTPEQNLAALLAQAHRLEQALAQFEFQKEVYEQEHPTETVPLWIQEEDYERRSPFAHTLDAVYLASVVLIQSRGLEDYLSEFKRRMGDPFDSWKAACRFDSDEDSPGFHSAVLREMCNLLAPFNIVSLSATQALHQAGIVYLERMLKHTAALVQWSGATPRNEADVYRAVRPLLLTLFPLSRDAGLAKFVKTFKSYKPDILVPDLSVAIEYKYIDSEQDLKTALDQIAVDVKAYTGDSGYETFYAVFYLTDHFCSEERFTRAWSEFEFPGFWKAIFVVAARG